MFSVQRKKEALGRGSLKLLPQALLHSVCEHVRPRSASLTLPQSLTGHTDPHYSSNLCILLRNRLQRDVAFLFIPL